MTEEEYGLWAEVERLNGLLKGWSDTGSGYEHRIADQRAEIERLLTKAEKDKNTLLISLEAATKEVQRLKEENEVTVRVCNENTDLKKLVTELCEALDQSNPFDRDDAFDLIQRAREATR